MTDHMVTAEARLSDAALDHAVMAEDLLTQAGRDIEEAERAYQRGNRTPAENSYRRAELAIAAAHVHAVLATVPQPLEAVLADGFDDGDDLG